MDEDNDRDRVVAMYDPRTGQIIRLPTHPGPFMIGGPDADVHVPGMEGIVAIAERQPDGSLRIARTDARSIKVGRNEPCPCGSGRKHKHCCAN